MIDIQPLQGFGHLALPYPGLHPGLFTFNPSGVLGTSHCHTPGCTQGYSHSTPSGFWAPRIAIPRVAPRAIHIQPLRGFGRLALPYPGLHPGLFTFNPSGVLGASHCLTPGCNPGLFPFNPSGGFGIGIDRCFREFFNPNISRRTQPHAPSTRLSTPP
jgi:hypothetical protein